MKKIKYEPNIDILRGISIILVVLYHLKLELFGVQVLPGGYLGVDIFFVISGYLITSILHINLKKNNFSFKEFFIRRFIRIFPVYVLVIIITLLASFFLLVPNQLYELSRSSVSSLFFFSNIFFWRFLNDYYNPDAIFNPLLHTWSLGIEIQFYIFFSIIFFILFKFTNRLKFSLFFLGCSSFIVSIIFSYIEPQINFFGFQSRIWEFLLGSFIFFFKSKIKLHIGKFLKYSIYFLILIFSIYFDENSRHPSYTTLIFLILVCIIILDSTNNKNNIFDKFLLFFGLISYSLYLWHYPILSLSERIFFNQTLGTKLFLILLSIITSFISYNFLEKKIKNNFKGTVYFSLLSIIVSFMFIYSIILSSGYPNRLSKTNFFKEKTKDINFVENKEKKISKKTILIIGNSHSVQTYQGFVLNNKIYSNYNFQNFHIQISCIDNEIFLRDYDRCKGKFDIEAKKKFEVGKRNLNNADLIILSTRWTNQDLENLIRVTNLLKNKNKNFIIFSNIFDTSKKDNILNLNNHNLTLLQKNYANKLFPYEKLLYLNNRHLTDDELHKLEKIYFNNLSDISLERSKILNKIANDRNIPILNLNDYLCNFNFKKCQIITDEKKHILYDTTGHLTMNGAKYLFKKIKPFFEKTILTN